MNNIYFLLKFNTTDLNEFLLDNKNYILDGCGCKGKKKDEFEYEGKEEMIIYNWKYEGELKNGLWEGFGKCKYTYKNEDIYDGYLKEGKKRGKRIIIKISYRLFNKDSIHFY